MCCSVQYNKKREELHRLKEKFPEQAARLESKGYASIFQEEEDESSSSSDDDDDGNISEKKEKQILETILKIRNKDTSIYDPNAKFYSSDDDEEEEDEGVLKVKKEKPVYLKDVVYKEALELAQGGDVEDDGPKERTYVEEQEDLKKAFLEAYDEDVERDIQKKDGFGGVLQKSDRMREEALVEDEETQKLVDKIFSNDEKNQGMTANDRFLRDYILNKAWMKDEDDYYEDEDLPDEDVEEDEEAYEDAEDFEADYNFRFEEPGGAEIVTHPRIIEGLVRKRDERRKQKRAEKAERKAQEEEERRRELKQLKNLKKLEIEDRLREIQNIAGDGIAEEDLIGKLLDGEFDPEEHDKAMAEAFGEDYYTRGDDEDDLEDEEFDKKLAAMAEYSSDEEADNTISAMIQKKAGQQENDSDSKEAAKEDVKKLLDDYFKLDYEDYVGGIPTRFRYKQVEPETYGLSFEEILMMDDKELNQVMGMKRVGATYHDGPKKRPNYGMLNEYRKSMQNQPKDGGKRRRDHGTKSLEIVHEHEQAHVEQTEADRRRDTFKKPKIKKKSHESRPPQKQEKEASKPSHENPETSGLTKAQRRNRRRSLNRAQKKTS